MRVIGIDPGLGATGYGVIETAGDGIKLVEAGVVSTDKRAGLPERLVTLHDELSAILSEFNPDLMVVEALYSHYRHPRTSIIMGHARGVLLLTAARAGIGVKDYPATTIKLAVAGHGRASKEQVGEMVRYLLELDEAPRPPDVTDALACALCHIGHQMGDLRALGGQG
ncbi:crossover junction endodeoxyribonuclease RuvC [candidate division KSB1 bacterium]